MGDFLRKNYEELDQKKFDYFKEKGAKAYCEKYGRFLPDGREVCDPTPMAIPLGCRKPLTLQEQLARLSPMAMYNLSRQWSDGNENEEDLLDPEDPEDYPLLEEIARRTAVNSPQSEKQTTAATPVAGNSPSVAQERNSEVPDVSKE